MQTFALKPAEIAYLSQFDKQASEVVASIQARKNAVLTLIGIQNGLKGAWELSPEGDALILQEAPTTG